MSTERELPKTVYARYPRHGRTARELAEKLGVHPRTAQRWTCEPREVFLERADNRRKAVLDLRLKGLPMAAIADELGVSVGTVHRYVKQAREAGELPPEVDNRKPGPRPRERKSA